MSLNIRPASRDDAALILRFVTELAIYERAEHEVKTDAAGIAPACSPKMPAPVR